MFEGNLFLIQLICKGYIYGYLLHESGTVYFISVLVYAKYCGYAGDIMMNKT